MSIVSTSTDFGTTEKCPVSAVDESVTVFKTYKFALYPTAEQEKTLRSWFSATRHIYNAALKQRNLYGRRKGTDVFYRTSTFRGCGKSGPDVNIQDNEVGSKKLAEDPELKWLTYLPSVCRQIALQDLDKAFEAFFERRTKYPTPRTFNRNNSVKFQCWGGKEARVVFGKDSVKFPKIGRIRYKKHEKPHGRYGQASIIMEGDRFFVCLTCKQGKREVRVDTSKPVGVDLGVTIPAMLSDGTCLEKDTKQVKLLEQEKKEQRKLSRCKKGSNRRNRQRRKLVKIKRKRAARRNGRQHEFTTMVVRKYSFIAVEDLQIKNMTKSAKGTVEEPGANVAQKAGLNREILNTAPYGFRLKMEYKAARAGKVVLPVPAQYTSQDCSECGHRHSENRINQAEFVCLKCGHTANADQNAARNVLSRALPGLATKPRKTPSEQKRTAATSRSVTSVEQRQTPIVSPYGPGDLCASGEESP